MEATIQFLQTFLPLSPELTAYLQQALKRKTVAKRERLLRAGQVCRSIYFIEEGLLRCYYFKEETEVCSWFMCEGDVIVSVESFFDQVTSYESIQALEDTVVHYISYTDLEYIYKNFPEFNYIGRVLLQKYYKLSEQRLYSIRMQTATERYQYLMKHFPNLVLRVPSSDIASYLGISRETLSRIKRG